MVNGTSAAPAEFGIGRLFEVVPDAVIIGDALTGSVLHWNSAAAHMFGYPPDESGGILIEHLVPESLRQAHRQGIARLADGEPTPLLDSESTVELRALRKDGSEFWIELRLAHIDGPEPGAYALAIIRDVTTRRMAQDALSHNVEELKSLTESMSQFLDAVAHDLRTPLTAIRGAAELMLDERLPETARAEMASMLVRQLVYADDLLGQLQAASRIEAGVAQPELEDCPLITALRQAIDLVGLGDHAELSVDVPAGLTVRADPSDLVRIVANYLTNARKYGEPPIEVTAEARGDRVVITVGDHGPGVPEDVRDRVFEKFSRAEGTRSRPGLGLGLAIAQGLADQNDGRVSYEPRASGGSLFRVDLARSRAAAARSAVSAVADAADAAPALAPDAGVRARVLVADDSAELRAVVARQLARGGYAVVEARDGSEALDLARSGAIEIALVDLDMPGLDGFGLLRQLRAEPGTASLPLILISGRAMPSDAARGLDLGAVDYLPKPFGGPELLARINNALRISRLQAELRERNEDLELLSRTDPLTGLWNRRHLDAHLHSAMSAAKRHDRPLAILLIDIDRFKTVNDRYGHQIGDAVLAQVAGRLAASVRAEDTIGRWGGEEFLAVLPDSDAAVAATVAERLRTGVSATPIECDGARLEVTVSIGVTGSRQPERDDLLRSADLGLRRAKAAGRNRTESA